MEGGGRVGGGVRDTYRSFNDKCNWVEQRYATNRTLLSQLINVQIRTGHACLLLRARAAPAPVV